MIWLLVWLIPAAWFYTVERSTGTNAKGAAVLALLWPVIVLLAILGWLTERLP